MDDSVIRQSILRQYLAGLEMLGKAIELCPEALWFSNDFANRFWHVAYHALFYTHFYAGQTEGDFQAWSKHQPNSNFLGPQPWAKEPFVLPAPYSKADVQEYWQLCRAEVQKQVPVTCLEESSGFAWLPFGKLETHLYNIRHLQHHAGQLIERLRTAEKISVGWVGTKPV